MSTYAPGAIVTHARARDLRFTTAPGNKLVSIYTGNMYEFEYLDQKQIEPATLPEDPVSISSYRQWQIDSVAANARHVLADHVIENPLDQGTHRYYRCGRPGSSVYAFRVLTAPGVLFLYGDVGDIAFQRTEDMLPFMKRNLDDPYYLAQKVWSTIETQTYSHEAAEVWVREHFAERIEPHLLGDRATDNWGDFEKVLEKETDVRNELFSAASDGEHAFAEVVHGLEEYNGDWPDYKAWEYSFVWALVCLRWFFERVPVTPEA